MHRKEERISEINCSDSTLHAGLLANTALPCLFPVLIQPLYKQLGKHKLSLAENQKQIVLVY